VTELEMLNGANRALVIDPDGTVEVIAFANVTANDFGSYGLDTLLRGLRGTDGCVGDHVVGALFLLLEQDTLHRLLLPLDELDEVRYYRAVGRDGSLLEEPGSAGRRRDCGALPPGGAAGRAGQEALVGRSLLGRRHANRCLGIDEELPAQGRRGSRRPATVGAQRRA
jgi:hypothetical protein